MKSFACGEVVPDCPAVFVGPDFEAVLHQVADHARSAHGLPDVPSEVVALIRGTVDGGRVAPGPRGDPR